MKQRVVGAIAISCEPHLLIADEPTTALDVTIQSQYLRLLRDIQDETGLSIIFITHDFGIVANMCDRVAVMYAGRLVESGPVRSIFNAPKHPYTQALLKSVPAMDRPVSRLYSIPGQPPALWDLPQGCRFVPRCPVAEPRCETRYPPAFPVADSAAGDHVASCWKLEDPAWHHRNPEARRGQEALPGHQGLDAGPADRTGARGGRDRSGHLGEPDPCARRRIGMRQDHDRKARASARNADRRPGAPRRRGHHRLQGPALKRYRTRVQAVFQDPWSSLNPRMRVQDIVAETLRVNHDLPRSEMEQRVAKVLLDVGLQPEQARNYPHEFSGGQRQRIAIASALISEPKLLILDEPVSALDVSIRSQIMNLLQDLQQQYGMTYLLVAHDLGTTRYMADWLAVMYLGRIFEYAEVESLFEEPRNPYTKALFSAALPGHPDVRREEIILGGEVPSPIDPPSGCSFHPRCPFKVGEVCERSAPELKPVPGIENHWVACHRY